MVAFVCRLIFNHKGNGLAIYKNTMNDVYELLIKDI